MSLRRIGLSTIIALCLSMPAWGKGSILVGHYRNYNGGFHDLSLLAVWEQGQLRRPTTPELCAIRGRRYRPVSEVPSTPAIRVPNKPLFSNEANRCIAHVSKARPRKHLIATSGISVRRLVPITPSPAERRQIDRRLLDALKLTAQQTLRKRQVTTVRIGAQRYTVITAIVGPRRCSGKPCKLVSVCGGMANHQAVTAVFSWEQGGQRTTLRYLTRQTITGPTRSQGTAQLVDLVVAKGQTAPWVVLFHDICECWDFEIIGQSKGKSWRSLVKARRGLHDLIVDESRGAAGSQPDAAAAAPSRRSRSRLSVGSRGSPGRSPGRRRS